MSAIPMEAFTLLGSSVLGTVSKLISMAMEARRQQKLLELQVLSGQDKIVDKARRYSNKPFQWTRRVIALMAVFFIIAFPKIVAFISPEIGVSYGYTQTHHSFLWFGGLSELIWQNAHGIVITPIDTHLLAAIIGLYFGGSLANR